MKLNELKERFQHKFTIRTVASILCVALAGSGMGVCALRAQQVSAVNAVAGEEQRAAKAQDTDTQKKAEKDSLDANGSVRQTIVSNWLKNGSKNAQIKDVSELSEIKNVKGEETFTQNGSNLTWNANGQDLYYQGTTQKELPISQKVTYYLDGKEIAPEQLAGKSGSVTIRLD